MAVKPKCRNMVFYEGLLGTSPRRKGPQLSNTLDLGIFPSQIWSYQAGYIHFPELYF